MTGAITAPSEATLRRALAGVDAAQLQRWTSEWVQASTTGEGGAPRWAGVAIDGTSVRGAACGGTTRPHLRGAATHDGAITLAQRQIPDKENDITELAALVAELDLAGTVVTVDARHPAGMGTQRLSQREDTVGLPVRPIATPQLRIEATGIDLGKSRHDRLADALPQTVDRGVTGAMRYLYLLNGTDSTDTHQPCTVPRDDPIRRPEERTPW